MLVMKNLLGGHYLLEPGLHFNHTQKGHRPLISKEDLNRVFIPQSVSILSYLMFHIGIKMYGRFCLLHSAVIFVHGYHF